MYQKSTLGASFSVWRSRICSLKKLALDDAQAECTLSKFSVGEGSGIISHSNLLSSLLRIDATARAAATHGSLPKPVYTAIGPVSTQ